MQQPKISRRALLAGAPAVATAWVLAHEAIAEPPSGLPLGASSRPARDTRSLIQSVELLTATPIAEMRRFYVDRLGIAVGRESADSLELLVGESRLTFKTCAKSDHRERAGRETGEPMYHFAFNIAPARLGGALAWLRSRVTLVAPRGDTRDDALPRDMWHFRHWRARSLFFFDPAYNIVELIARSEFGAFDMSSGAFSAADLQCVSEIGFVMRAGESNAAARQLNEKFGLTAYPPGTSDWWAMGDEHGLLLCLARDGDLWGEHTDTPVRWGMFPANVVIRGEKASRFAFEGMPHKIECIGRG